MSASAPARKAGGKGNARSKSETAIIIGMKATSTGVGAATCSGILA